MTLRFALATAAIFLAVASTAPAAHQGIMLEMTFGCPSMNDTERANALWKSKGYNAAWKVAKPKGCLPFSRDERVHIFRGGETAVCAVRDGESTECLWIPAGLAKPD